MNTRKLLIGALVLVGVFGFSVYAGAQLFRPGGGGVFSPGFWKLSPDSASLLPESSAYHLGSSAARIAKGWFTDLDASTLTVSSVATSPLIVGGSATSTISGTTSTATSFLGNVGIGTTSPGANVDIQGASGLDGATPVTLRIYSTNDGTWTDQSIPARVDLGTADTNVPGAGTKARIASFVEGAGGGTTGLSFYTSNTTLTEKMRIKGDGSVGIGTSTIGATLDVYNSGTAHIRSIGATNPYITAKDTTNNVVIKMQALDSSGYTGTETNHPYSLISNNAVAMTVATSSNVGIGTTTPPTALTVWRNASSTIQIGDAVKTACIAMGDSDGAGITYVTALDGVLTGTTTKPTICQ